MVFKRCTLCGKEWPTKDEFLEDISLHLNGHQWNRKKVQAGLSADGLLIFTHTLDECGTSLAIEASQFKEKRVSR